MLTHRTMLLIFQIFMVVPQAVYCICFLPDACMYAGICNMYCCAQVIISGIVLLALIKCCSAHRHWLVMCVTCTGSLKTQEMGCLSQDTSAPPHARLAVTIPAYVLTLVCHNQAFSQGLAELAYRLRDKRLTAH